MRRVDVMSGSGKGGNNRKNRHRFSKHDKKKSSDNLFTEAKFERNKVSLQERPSWTAPVQGENPITTPDCPWCGKQITDITTAITDKETGLPVHFDCVLARLSNMEALDTNDSICYIGGGRFGIIHLNNPPDTRDFTIKKVFEWEAKDTNMDWRKPISEYFSIT
jgi:hypothetical protein